MASGGFVFWKGLRRFDNRAIGAQRLLQQRDGQRTQRFLPPRSRKAPLCYPLVRVARSSSVPSASLMVPTT